MKVRKSFEIFLTFVTFKSDALKMSYDTIPTVEDNDDMIMIMPRNFLE